ARNTTRLNTQLYAANCAVSSGTPALTRMSVPSANVKVNTNSVSANFVNGSFSTSPMIRGVSCWLASCTMISSADETNTTNVNIEAASVPRSAIAVSREVSSSHPSDVSTPCRMRTATSAAAIPATGKAQMAVVTYCRRRYRCSQVMGAPSVLLRHEVAALERRLVVVLPLGRALGELDLVARHLLVRDQAQQVRDAVEAGAALV